jgi:hypothetical protein
VRIALHGLGPFAPAHFAFVHYGLLPPLVVPVPPPVVVVVLEPPPVVPLLWVVFVVFVVLVRVLPPWFQGCHTKRAISATITMTATKLKVATDPPLSRSTVTLRSSIGIS